MRMQLGGVGSTLRTCRTSGMSNEESSGSLRHGNRELEQLGVQQSVDEGLATLKTGLAEVASSLT